MLIISKSFIHVILREEVQLLSTINKLQAVGGVRLSHRITRDVTSNCVPIVTHTRINYKRRKKIIVTYILTQFMILQHFLKVRLSHTSHFSSGSQDKSEIVK